MESKLLAVACVFLLAAGIEAYPNRQESLGVSSKSRSLRKILSMGSSEGKIVFPADEPEKYPGLAPSCKASTFCENPPYYPVKYVDAVLKANSNLKLFSGSDLVTDIVQRIDTSDDTPLCSSTEQIVYPKSAKSSEKLWLFILNQDNFTQGVRIETCGKETECHVIDGLVQGYQTFCKQKFIYRKLVAVLPTGIGHETFRFPASCCCHIRFNGDLQQRLANFGRTNMSVTTSPRRK